MSFLARLPMAGSSLVGRLVLAASAWCLVLLVVAGAGLTASFNHAAEVRLDQSLAEDADDLYAGTAVGPGGEVFAPAITDVRATRAYSGKYWELGEIGPDGQLHGLVLSRSMWDVDTLPTRPDLLKALRARPAGRVTYDGIGPHDQHLRITAMQRILSGRSDLWDQRNPHLADLWGQWALSRLVSLAVLPRMGRSVLEAPWGRWLDRLGRWDPARRPRLRSGPR